MAQQRENDGELSKAADQLGHAFSRILRATFLAAAAPGQRKKAARLLEQFDGAAQRLRAITQNASSKTPFNLSSSRTPERLRLLSHLPSREQFSAMREFYAVSRAVRLVSQDIGGRLIQHEMGQGTERAARAGLAFPQS